MVFEMVDWLTPLLSRSLYWLKLRRAMRPRNSACMALTRGVISIVVDRAMILL